MNVSVKVGIDRNKSVMPRKKLNPLLAHFTYTHPVFVNYA